MAAKVGIRDEKKSEKREDGSLELALPNWLAGNGSSSGSFLWYSVCLSSANDRKWPAGDEQAGRAKKKTSSTFDAKDRRCCENFLCDGEAHISITAPSEM